MIQTTFPRMTKAQFAACHKKSTTSGKNVEVAYQVLVRRLTLDKALEVCGCANHSARLHSRKRINAFVRCHISLQKMYPVGQGNPVQLTEAQFMACIKRPERWNPVAFSRTYAYLVQGARKHYLVRFRDVRRILAWHKQNLMAYAGMTEKDFA